MCSYKNTIRAQDGRNISIFCKNYSDYSMLVDSIQSSPLIPLRQFWGERRRLCLFNPELFLFLPNLSSSRLWNLDFKTKCKIDSHLKTSTTVKSFFKFILSSIQVRQTCLLLSQVQQWQDMQQLQPVSSTQIKPRQAHSKLKLSADRVIN